MNLDNIKDEIKKHINAKVNIHIYGMRNKNYEITGFISGAYPSIFTVTENGIERSFSYSDIATKEIVIKYL